MAISGTKFGLVIKLLYIFAIVKAALKRRFLHMFSRGMTTHNVTCFTDAVENLTRTNVRQSSANVGDLPVTPRALNWQKDRKYGIQHICCPVSARARSV